MELSVLIDKLRIDAGKTEAELGFFTARRCLERAAIQINRDLATAYEITGDDEEEAEIDPDPPALHQELLLILAKRHLVSIGVLDAANAISFKDGDKQVDRSRKALSTENILKALWKEYLDLAGLPEDRTPLIGGSAWESTGGDADYTQDRPWAR